MPTTDNSAGPTAGRAYRRPQHGPLPDVPLYERLIDDGIAAAHAGSAPSTTSPPGCWPSGRSAGSAEPGCCPPPSTGRCNRRPTHQQPPRGGLVQPHAANVALPTRMQKAIMARRVGPRLGSGHLIRAGQATNKLLYVHPSRTGRPTGVRAASVCVPAALRLRRRTGVDARRLAGIGKGTGYGSGSGRAQCRRHRREQGNRPGHSPRAGSRWCAGHRGRPGILGRPLMSSREPVRCGSCWQIWPTRQARPA